MLLARGHDLVVGAEIEAADDDVAPVRRRARQRHLLRRRADERAEPRAGFRPQPEHPLEVLLPEPSVLQLVVELRPDGVSRRLRDRAEGARVEIGEPLEHREERPRLRGRHPIFTSTGAWSESTAPL